MLNEPVGEPLAPGAAGGGQAGGQLPGMGAMPMPDEASYIHVTQEEKQAIDRVSALIVLGIGQTIIFSSCRLFFFLLLLVSLKAQDAKKSPKIAIWAPSHNFVGLYLRKKDTYEQSEKNLLSSNMSSTCPHSVVNFGPLAAEIDPVV